MGATTVTTGLVTSRTTVDEKSLRFERKAVERGSPAKSRSVIAKNGLDSKGGGRR